MRWDRIILPALGLAFAAPASAQLRDSVTLPLPGAGIIHGFVADRVERPLDSVEVTIESLKRTTFTARDGSFRFSDVKPGKYQLRARRLGFYPDVRPVTVGEEGGATAFWLSSRGVTLPSVVTSANRGGLSGVVSDTQYKAIAGITIEGMASDTRTQSDSTGAFFLDLKPGKHMVRVYGPGYGSKMLSVTIPKDSGRQVSVWLAPANRGLQNRETQQAMALENRLNRRNVVWSTIYTRDDIAKSGKKNLQEIASAGAGRFVDPTQCNAIVDGGPLQIPVWALDASEIDMVEVYVARPPRQTQTSIMNGPRRTPVFTNACPQVFAWLRK